MRALGAEFEALQQMNLQYVVHSLEVNYKKPARMDDELTVTAKVVTLGRTYIQFQQQVRRTSEVLCEASIKVACVHAVQLKPIAIPESLATQFRKL